MINNIPTSLWYRINEQVNEEEIIRFLDKTVKNLAEIDENEAEKLKNLSVFISLSQNKKSCGAELREGPMAILLLFALRRHFKNTCVTNVSGDHVLIVDDSNEHFPEKYDDLDHWIGESCKEMLIDKGWLCLDDNGNEPSFQIIAARYNLEHYICTTNIQQHAIAMGCINAPIDFSEIQSDQKSAYF